MLAIGFIQDGLFKYANEAYCDISGYSIDEIMSWKPYEYIKVVHPDDREFVMAQAKKKQTGASDATPSYQFKGLTKSGEVKWLELYSKTVLYKKKQADLFMFIDVTDRTQARKALQESEERFRRFSAAAFEAIVIHEEGVLISGNDQFYEKFGYKPEDLIGKDIVLSTVAPEAIETVRKEIDASGMGPYESIGIKKDGTRFPMEIRVREWRDEERKLRVAAIMDISERKRKEEELENYRKHLEDLVKRRTAGLEAKNKELEVFTYSVSHDLKAPLRGIDGYSRLLEEEYSDKLDEEGLLFLNNVRQSAAQMNLLIEDLLAYSRMERRQLQPVSIAVRPMIDTLVSQKSHDIEACNIRISVNLPFEVMTSDLETLRQVLDNYLDNAIKFMKKDSSGVVEVGGKENQESWTLWVKDNGIGFDPQYHDRIFNIFQRLHRSEDYPGTGVGLAIVRKAVERIDGRVWAESEIGKGSVFFISIPKKRDSYLKGATHG